MHRLVILEDETECLDVLRAILVRGGYEALIANTCSEVQTHMDRNPVDALVLDVFLRTQWCRGTDVALRAQSAHPAVRILFVSGTALGDWSEADRRNLARLAETSWDALQKPFTPATLLSRLSALLARPASPGPVHAGCPRNRDCANLNPPGAGSPIH